EACARGRVFTGKRLFADDGPFVGIRYGLPPVADVVIVDEGAPQHEAGQIILYGDVVKAGPGVDPIHEGMVGKTSGKRGRGRIPAFLKVAPQRMGILRGK